MRESDDARGLGDRVFTVPNALSLLRLFMVPVVVALLLARADALGAAFFVLAAATDFLDGRLAVGSKIRVNRVGKAATAVLMGAVALVVISPGVAGEILFYAGFGLSIVAGLMYVRSVRRIFGGGELR